MDAGRWVNDLKLDSERLADESPFPKHTDLNLRVIAGRLQRCEGLVKLLQMRLIVCRQLLECSAFLNQLLGFFFPPPVQLLQRRPVFLRKHRRVMGLRMEKKLLLFLWSNFLPVAVPRRAPFDAGASLSC